ncbi:hypothetical protein HYX09_00300 [Candidatus Woesearchaeota archaeon]|nr:hypothetical protein [Candidatus Woesearchaeota archaeon]
MSNVKKKIKGHFAAARRKLQAAERKAGSFVRTHPGKAVAIAAGVGAAVGAAVAVGIAAAIRKYKKKR